MDVKETTLYFLQFILQMDRKCFEKADVEKRILDTTSFKKLEMNYSIDKSLIGGMVIRIGDRVVDTSIKTKLAELTKELNKIQLA